MVKCPLKLKLKDLRYKYGESAKEYFREHYKCESCGEDRLAVLTLHHTKGKKVEEYQTLCFNCHMLIHSKTPEHTAEMSIRKDTKRTLKSEAIRVRNIKIKQMVDDGISYRKIGEVFGISHTMVFHIVK
jgi:transposase-like protein